MTMLNIFAIDPAICQSLEWFRYCIEHCHTSKGRAIANLPPGQWCEKALKYINQCVSDRRLGPVKGQSLKRRLNMVRDRLVHRPGTNWDYLEESWLSNAEKEHQQESFAAVVSPEYEGADRDNRFYHPDELDESVLDWNTPNGMDITRSAGDFTTAIMPMLNVAKEIHFLDRSFNVDSNSLYTHNYKKIFQTLAMRGDTYPKITIHCCPDVTIDHTYFETELARHYSSLIPEGCTVICLMWKVNRHVDRGAHPFHNRYILSEHCGVMIGYGTDSANVATDAPDTLQIVDHNVFLEKLKNSRKRTHPMISVREEFIIEGTAK